MWVKKTKQNSQLRISKIPSFCNPKQIAQSADREMCKVTSFIPQSIQCLHSFQRVGWGAQINLTIPDYMGEQINLTFFQAHRSHRKRTCYSGQMYFLSSKIKEHKLKQGTDFQISNQQGLFFIIILNPHKKLGQMDTLIHRCLEDSLSFFFSG